MPPANARSWPQWATDTDKAQRQGMVTKSRAKDYGPNANALSHAVRIERGPSAECSVLVTKGHKVARSPSAYSGGRKAEASMLNWEQMHHPALEQATKCEDVRAQGVRLRTR